MSTPALTFDPWIGTTLKGTYQIVGKIADGGMGAVYEAKHLRLGQRVALKLLLPESALRPELIARFRREAEIVANLGHPHIVSLLDVDQTEQGQPFLVMEYLEGETLAARLSRQPEFDLPTVASIAQQIASGLACTHEQGIVHRDLKPENVFLVRATGERDFVKILDYGVSKVIGAHITCDQAVLGTPAYMAPEQVRAPASVDHRIDQYALAAIVYEMFCGKPPHAGRTVAEILDSILGKEPLPLSELASWVPAEIERVVMRALHRDPNLRYPSISEFSTALAGALTQDRVSGVRTRNDPNSDGARGLAMWARARAAFVSERMDDAVQHSEELFDLAVFGRDPAVLELMRSATPTLDRIFEARVGARTRRIELTARGRDRASIDLLPNAERLLRLADSGANVGGVLDICGMPRRHAVRMLAGLLRRGMLVTL
jgi:serine/threonine protein kinase